MVAFQFIFFRASAKNGYVAATAVKGYGAGGEIKKKDAPPDLWQGTRKEVDEMELIPLNANGNVEGVPPPVPLVAGGYGK